MNRLYLGSTALAACIVLAACSEQQPTVSGPEFSKPSVPGPCDLIQSSINASLRPPAQQAAQDQLTLLLSAPNATVKKERGYDILRILSQATNAGSTQGTVTDRSGLANNVFGCVLPDWSTIDFSAALTPSNGGAFYVRGGEGDATNFVLGTKNGANISGMGPPILPTDLPAPHALDSLSWDEILDDRVLIYGFEITGGYDWALVPANATFSPFAVVALCAVEATTSTMITEEDVGILPYETVTTDAICGSTKSVAVERIGWSPLALWNRAARFGSGLLRPQPLHAAVAVAKVGSTPTGAKSEFKPKEVTSSSILAQFLTPPPPSRPKVNVSRITVTVQISSGGDNLLSFLGTLTAVNNNGVPTQILQVIDPAYTGCELIAGKTQVPPAVNATVSDGKSVLQWTNICNNKSGALKFVMTGAVPNRAGTATASSNKINYVP